MFNKKYLKLTFFKLFMDSLIGNLNIVDTS